MIRSDLVGHIMTNQRANYQLTAITLGMILLGGTILGSTPFAFADHNDDKKLKAKLKDLLEKIKAKIKDKRDREKCKESQKYEGVCDTQRPTIEIKKPRNKDKLPEGEITFELKAKDKGSGLAKVQLRINDGPFQDATLISGDNWKFVPVPDLVPGNYKATAKATDNVGNTKRDSIKFKVIEANDD